MTEKEALQKLRVISGILKNNANLNDDEIKEIANKHPEILNADPNTIKDTVNLFINVYLSNKKLSKTMFINFPAVLTDSKKVKDVANVLYNRFGFKQHNIGNILCANPCIITDFEFYDINPYLNQMKSELNISETTLRNMFLKSTIFGNQNTYMIDVLDEKFKLLEVYGIAKNMTEENPSILGNSLLKISTRIKLAMINGLELEKFVKNKNYIISEKVIYSRMMENAKHKNDPTSIYNNPLTNEEQYKLIQQYPFNKEAQNFVNNEFKVTFPELNRKVDVFFENLHIARETKIKNSLSPVESSGAKAVSTLEQTEEKPKEIKEEKLEEQSTESTTPNHIKRAMRVLGVGEKGLNIICCSLGIEDFNEEKLNHIMNNYTLLLGYGFDSVEILASPSCLKLDPEKLELRVKLAKINGRTDHQFLTRDYKYSEETIFARTCGVKIMARQTDKPANVYGSETKFAKSFGGDTKTLLRLCELNEKNKNVLEILYSQIPNGNENE